MKKALLALFISVTVSTAFSQSESIDPRLVEVIPVKKLEWMQTNAPERLEYFQSVLDFSYELIEVTDEIRVKTESMTVVEIEDPENINILKFASAPLEGPQYFFDAQRDVIIRVKSEAEFQSTPKGKK